MSSWLLALSVTTAFIAWGLALWGVPTGALAVSVGVSFAFALVPTRRARIGLFVSIAVNVVAALVTGAWHISWSIS